MKTLLSQISRGYRSQAVWASILALVAGALFLAFMGPASDASGKMPAAPAEAAPAIVDLSAASVGAVGAAARVEASASVTSTVFLPFVPRGFPTFPETPFGVQLPGPDLELIAVADELGAKWVRFFLPWSSFEPVNTTPENYTWPTPYDEAFKELAKRNIQPIVIIHGNPEWAATYRGGVIDKVDISEFAQFMAALAGRYGKAPYNAKHWEFYNEPDNGNEIYAAAGWGYWGNDPEAYADMLAAVYGPMKAADPRAQIVFGGLAYDNWTYEGGPFVYEFLDGVLEHGGGDYFDIMNFHYYWVFYWGDYGKGIMGKAEALRQKLAEYGVSKPMVCTETSQWTSVENGGSEEKQALYIPKTYARSMAWGLKSTIWFKLVDSTSISDWGYGLLHADLSPKLGFYVYQTLTEQLAPTEYARTWSDAETGHAKLEAHEFAHMDGSTRIIVAWTNDDLTHDLAVSTSQVVMVSKYGNQTTIRDGDDGVVDGVVHVTISPSAVYLRFQP